jgi:hypothetical protein
VVSTLSGLGRRVRKAGLALPVETAVSIDRDSGRMLPITPALASPEAALGPLRAVAPPQPDGDRRALDSPTAVDAVCTWSGFGGEDLLAPAARGLTLHRVAASVVNMGAVKRDALGALARMVAGARCYSIGWGRPQQLLDSVLAAIRDDTGLARIGRPSDD